MSSKLSHLDRTGQARMVDVGHKSDTERVALAQGEVVMQQETLALIRAGAIKKGDVLYHCFFCKRFLFIKPSAESANHAEVSTVTS